ncbi:ArsR/SmtB family transcription factor [Streptomyces shenzhenensis]|uniref:ArsR/SmtB family transcription factor n=1 Tax=Streptomyces shenzhenensis TaxID=943815 RepID=UPI0036C3A73A
MTVKDPRAAGLAALAGLLADRTRAACLLALLDGRAWTNGELARHAGVAASTLSEHLGKLVAGGLLTEERQGRHRYVRLADARVAQLVEELTARVAPEAAAPRPRTLREASAGSALARGRTCYDHLAGRLGIAITDALTERGLLSVTGGAADAAAAPPWPVTEGRGTGFALTEAGLKWFGDAGIGLAHAGRRPLARACLDWTERRPHLAGVAGAELCRHALDTGWCVRIGSGRAVRLTTTGERTLSALLGINPDTLH